jgi:single-stranded DNA-binding protein
MSLDILTVGRLAGKPQSRTSKNGNAYVSAKIRAAMANGENAFIHVIAFSDTVKTTLLALDHGDAVSITGELKVGIYTDKEGVAKPSLDLTAHAVLTEYHIQRKRRAVTESAEPAPAAAGEWQ